MAAARGARADRTVSVDRSSVKLWGMARSGYSVHLDGRIGAWWAESFRRLEADRRTAWRFYLDEEHGVVAFASGPQAVAEALDRLAELVGAANSEAARHTDGIPADAAGADSMTQTRHRRG